MLQDGYSIFVCRSLDEHLYAFLVRRARSLLGSFSPSVKCLNRVGDWITITPLKRNLQYGWGHAEIRVEER